MRAGRVIAVFLAAIILALFVPVFPLAGSFGQATASSAPLIKDLDDLADKRIGVMTASVQDIYATERYPNATISRFNSQADAIAALQAGKVDAMVGAYISLLEAQKRDPSLVFLDEKTLSQPVGVAFQKGDAALRSDFEAFLEQIKSDGTLDDMLERYFDNDEFDMPEIATTNQNGQLVYGTVPVLGLPFISVMGVGDYVGIEMELAKRFASYIGKELVVRSVDFSGLIASLAAGRVEMIGGGIAITEERQLQVDFSSPVYYTYSAIMSKSDKVDMEALAASTPEAGTTSSTAQYDSEDIVSPAALAVADGKTVGAMSGSNSAIMLDMQSPTTTIKHYDDIVDAVLALKSGHVDYVLTSTTRAKAFLYQDPTLEIVPDVIVVARAPCIGVQKGNAELLSQINAAIDKFREDGTLDDLERRWIKFDGTPYEPADVELLTEGPVLTVAFASSSEPMSFKDATGEPAGFDADLSRYIALELGMQIEFLDLNFTAMVAAVQSGKADMAISNISATLERKNALDFSQEYFSNPQVFLRVTDAAPTVAAPSFLERIKDSFYRNIVYEQRYLLILDGLRTTILISLLALVFGTILGALICAMRMAKNAALRNVAKVFIEVLRGIPVLVILMVIYYIVFASVNIDPFIVATIAFGMNFAAYVAEMFRTGIESVDGGQTEAGIAGGFTPIQTFIYIVMPQAAQRILPVYKGEFISLVKMTSVVGYIAVQDLTKAGDIIRSRTMEAFFPLIMVAVLYFLISWLLTLALSYAEKRIDPKIMKARRAKA